MPHRLMDMLHTPIISVTFGAMFATGVVIDEKSLVPIGTLGGVCALVWWIGRKLQRIDDRLETLTTQSNRMEEAALQVAKLPCMVEGKVCSSAKDTPLKMKQ